MQITPGVKAVVGLGVYNLLQNFVIRDRWYVPANLMMASGLVVAGRRAGHTLGDMGLDPVHFRSGGRLGTAVATATGLAAAGVSLSGRFDRLLLDRRAEGHPAGEALYRSAVRFPLGTALFEEVAFRGVLDAMWRRSSGDAGARLVTAAAFGAWHLVPTFRDYRQMAGTRMQEPGVVERCLAAVGGVILTGLSGVGFTMLRERSGSVVAPWLAHAAFNTSGYLAARRAWRSAGQAETERLRIG